MTLASNCRRQLPHWLRRTEKGRGWNYYSETFGQGTHGAHVFPSWGRRRSWEERSPRAVIQTPRLLRVSAAGAPEEHNETWFFKGRTVCEVGSIASMKMNHHWKK